MVSMCRTFLLTSCRSDRPRRAAVVNYFADGVYSNSDETLLNGVPVIPKVYPIT